VSRRQNDSLSALLTRMNLLVSGAALLMAGLAFFSYDLLSLRHALIRDLAAEAQIIGDNTVSALAFNGKKSAATTLNDLRRSPDVLAAALNSSDGTPFALYRTPDQGEAESHLLSVRETDRVWSSGTHVLLAHRVFSHGQPVGILYISAQLAEIGQRAR
jgi:hypothetical protein